MVLIRRSNRLRVDVTDPDPRPLPTSPRRAPTPEGGVGRTNACGGNRKAGRGNRDARKPALPRNVVGGMKGDRVEIVVDAGGSTKTYEVVATRAGRRVEITHGGGVVEVTEVSRGGTPIRTARFMASRVLALVEHPASRAAAPDDTGS